MRPGPGGVTPVVLGVLLVGALLVGACVDDAETVGATPAVAGPPSDATEPGLERDRGAPTAPLEALPPPTGTDGNEASRTDGDHRRCPVAAVRSVDARSNASAGAGGETTSDPEFGPETEINAGTSTDTGSETGAETGAGAGTGDEPDGSRRGGGPDESRQGGGPVPPPRVVELYPNPLTDGNVGEYFVLAVPAETSLENWTVTDGYATATFPDRTVSGRVAVSTDPNATRSLTADPVVELAGHLPLAVDGDEIAVRSPDGVVDAVSYDRAPLGEVWYRTSDGASGARHGDDSADELGDERSVTATDAGTWWPRGATCRPVTTASVDGATPFVLPDSPGIVRETLRSAEDRVLLAGYTFTSEAVAAELRRATARDVEVSVLLEGGPVGGTPAATPSVLDDLAGTNASIRVLGGRGARYPYHHAKYAVVDDRAIVTTENWKPSGMGGAGSRGWGVVVDDERIAGELARIFAADFGGRDTTPWDRYRRDESFTESDAASGDFESYFAPERVGVDEVEVLVAPDNARGRLRELLRSAEESIRVQQVRIGDRDFPLLRDLLEAARRGVEVRILLDATWYVESENLDLARSLERTAAAEGLPLSVKLVEPRDRFAKIHAKGVVIDGETVVVGSANWNENSLRENREVLLVLHGPAAGEYYAAVFDEDWSGGAWPLPVGLVITVVTGLVGCGLAGRRTVDFAGAPDGGSRRSSVPLDARAVGFCRRLTEEISMDRVLESDVAFYYAVGGFVIAIFVSGIVAVSIVSPASIDTRTLIPLSVGFFLFMLVYFVSISIRRIEVGEDV